MQFNSYILNPNSVDLLEKRQIQIPDKIYDNLILIEKEIVNEYLNEQKDKIGILKLGYPIKKNKVLQSIFSNEFENQVIVKATENKRSFFKLFINTIAQFSDKEIYFFVLEEDFGKESNLVDSTFITIDEIKEDLEKLLFNFKFKKQIKINFIEFFGFTDYFVHQTSEYKDTYSKIIPK